MRNENITLIDNGDIIMDVGEKSGVLNTYKSYVSCPDILNTRYAAIISLFFIFFRKCHKLFLFIITEN